MRAIKFRAWDKDANSWVNAITLTLHTSGNLINLPPSIELQQYTGLKDRNGKEVYEGDIVYDEGHRFNLAVKWRDGKGEDLGNYVGWWLGDGRYKLEFEAYLGAYENDREEYLNATVIGNIYENPELLNQ